MQLIFTVFSLTAIMMYVLMIRLRNRTEKSHWQQDTYMPFKYRKFVYTLILEKYYEDKLISYENRNYIRCSR